MGDEVSLKRAHDLFGVGGVRNHSTSTCELERTKEEEGQDPGERDREGRAETWQGQSNDRFRCGISV